MKIKTKQVFTLLEIHVYSYGKTIKECKVHDLYLGIPEICF